MQIKTVHDNQQKALAYRQQMGRYERAIENGFYYEAMLIVYAVMEDRLRSLLYYIGAVRRAEDPKLNVRKTKAALRAIYFGSEEIAFGKRLDLSSISVKIELIRKTILWAESFEGKPDNRYLEVLKREYEGCLDMGGLLQVLNLINEWRNYRNELIHGLLNKDCISIENSILDKVEEGKGYVRFIDSQVRALKKNNRIRRDNRIKR